MSVRRILVIAGSDSSGGAGLEADQKVIAAHGCYAMTATTALTAQNTQGVYGIHETPPKFLQMQIEACIDDVGVDVVKTGMLASAEAISVVADAFRRYHIQKIVVDPVMVATTGARLLPQEAVQTLHKEILPITTVLTPNIPEAKLLLELAGKPVPKLETREDMVEIAKAVQSLGPKYVLLKGGHHPFVLDGSRQANDLEEGIILDVLFGDGQATCFSSKFIHTKNTHGTGCSLASAVACCLSKGMDVPESARAACRYVEAGIKLSLPIGKGHGPINHFHSLYSLPFAPGRFVEYLLARADVQEAWKLHTEHEFVNRLADGTLPLTAFKQYLIQDYLYLIQFARANALAAYKARTMDDITMSANIVGHIQREMSLHIDFCKGFGLSKEDMENEKESQACVAYTRYVLDVGQSGDWLGLQISLAPCLIGYGHIARRLHDDPKTLREGNIYWKWIENYVADDYVEAVRVGSELLEKHAVEQSPKRIEELVEIFIEATKMEAGFWDMGYGDKL